jgi:ATP-binding cassette subfamily B protein
MRGIFRQVAPYVWRYRKGMALGIGALILKDVLGATLPLVMRSGVDSLTRSSPSRVVLQYAGLLVALALAKGLFQYWMRVIIIGVSRDVEYDLRNRLFSHLVSLSSSFYTKYRTGDIMARATNDLNAVRMMLGPGIMYWTETALTAVLAIAIMLWADWRMTLIALIPAPLVTFVVVVFGRRIHDRFEKIQAMFSDISSRVQENLAGVRVIRAYTQESAEMRKFETLNREYIHHNIRLARLSGLFNPLLTALIALTFLLVLWVGGYRLLSHRITLGSFVMFNTYMGMLVWPMIAMGWVVNLIQRGTASWERIEQLLRERPAITGLSQGATPVRGEIEFHNVEVSYPTGDVLRKVNLRIPAGSTVAIVGHTGSGKSTLVNLIPRLLDPTRGAITLDGVDLHGVDPEWVRRQIGFVPQETFLFSASLGENIAWGVENVTPEQIERAAELAGLGPDIAAFPNGFETVVGERGITLSGGQKQRTAIARAILRNPPILILDDALSSVDTLTEERILTGLSDVMRGRTTILISHRVSTVRSAGRIFVLERGEIAEQGTHAELILNGGYYGDLYQKQLLEEELEAI